MKQLGKFSKVHAAVVAAVLLAVVLTGVLARAAARRYGVWGVDVSAYQGMIDWDGMAAQGVSFAFVKATEGSGTTDARFSENFAGARAKLKAAGAYHFFSFDSPGETQAENFIAAVGSLKGCLPPVVDVELYGEYKTRPMQRAGVMENLMPLLRALEAEYGVKPILYMTQASALLYGLGDEYPLWRRNVFFPPLGGWDFWQYSDRGALGEYDGEEKHIDLNVFRGGEEEMRAMLLP